MKLLFPGLVVLTLCAGAAAFLLREPPPAEHQVANRPIQDTEAEYSSSNACRACHPAQYASWRASYHRTMTQVATPETVVADFDRVTVAHAHGRPMTLERRGREFWATFDDPDSRLRSPEQNASFGAAGVRSPGSDASVGAASRAGLATRSAAARL